MSEIILKPCPFCGARSALTGFNVSPYGKILYEVDCTNCAATINSWFDSEQEAAEAWNKRAEPESSVAHAYWIGLDSDAEQYDDIKCSACGKSFTVDAYRWCDIGFTESDLNYCPNCGAKMDEGASV